MKISSLTLLRTGATALISIAVAMQTLYPSYTWIAVVVAAASAVGIHAIPAVTQAATAAIPIVTTEVAKMADNDNDPVNAVGVNGMKLMGLTPPAPAQKTADPAPAPVEPVTPTPVAVPEPVTAPVATVTTEAAPPAPEVAQKTAEPVTAPTVDTDGLAEVLQAASAALAAVAAKLS